MYREILEKLVDWKEREGRGILLLAGQKGVGKTYTLRDFGDGCFNYTAIIDLKKQDYIRTFLEDNPQKDRLLSIFEISCGGSMIEGQTLIVLENADALSDIRSLIHFLDDNMKEYHIVITSSVREKDFMERVGDGAGLIQIMHLYPLNFKEFLNILGSDSLTEKIKDSGKMPLSAEDKKTLDKYMRMYLYMGGMPSVVQKYIDTENMQVVQNEKDRLLENFVNDINQIEYKALSDKVMQVWKSITAQLEKENKKFQFGVVKLTARAREYNDAVEWLYKNKYFDKVYRSKEPVNKLSDHFDEKSYEVYVTDIGLLASMYNISYEEMCESEDVSQLKGGALVEQFVYQELTSNENISEIFYWISEATAKIEFMFEDSGEIIPVEINLNENTKAQSMKVYKSRYKPVMCITITKDNMDMGGGAIRLPMYAIWNL